MMENVAPDMGSWTDAVESYIATRPLSSAADRLLAQMMRSAAKTVEATAAAVGAAVPDCHIPGDVPLGVALGMLLDDAEKALDALMRLSGPEVYEASQTVVAVFSRLLSEARERRTLALADAYTPEAQESAWADYAKAVRVARRYISDTGEMVDALGDSTWVDRLRDDGSEG